MTQNRVRQKIQIWDWWNTSKIILFYFNSRNVLLEKKQRKFDAEIGLLQEDRKQEMSQREKLQREVDALKAQKYGLEEQIHVSTYCCFLGLSVSRYFVTEFWVVFFLGKLCEIVTDSYAATLLLTSYRIIE